MKALNVGSTFAAAKERKGKGREGNQVRKEMIVDTTMCILVAAVAMTDESFSHSETGILDNESPSTPSTSSRRMWHGRKDLRHCKVMSREDLGREGMGKGWRRYGEGMEKV